MAIYRGQFKDVNNDLYTVTIDAHLISSSDEVEVTLGETPIVITTNSDGIFSPIKSRSCTIQLFTHTWLFDLYSPTAKGVSVKLQKGLNTIFFGYLTPNSYDQTYTYVDTLDLEAVDAVSVLKDFKYETVSSIPTYQKLTNILCRLLKNAGYSGMLYIPNSLIGYNNNSNSNTVGKLYLSEGNFFDDDEEHSAWTQYEVLEEILRYLNFTLYPWGDDVYLLDYRYISNSASTTYTSYEISTSILANNSVSLSNSFSIGINQYAAGSPSLSMDEVFNKIELNDNLYEINEIAPDIFDDNTHISINDEKNLSVNGSKWVKTTVKKHWLRSDEVTSEVTGYDYQTICRIKPSSNWIHHFYRMANISTNPTEVQNIDGQNYYDGDIGSLYVNGPINQYVNTHGCLMQHYAYIKKNANILPNSIDWDDILTFFVVNDKVNTNGTIDMCTQLELPVLEYVVPEQVLFKPISGTSWITIKGDLFYQYNNARYGNDGNNTLKIINTDSHYYTTAPVDKSCDISDAVNFKFIERTYNNGTTSYGIWDYLDSQYKSLLGEYGTGFKMWKFKVQLGNKFWNGSQWTSTDSTFYISYNNNPENNVESMPVFKWANIVENTTYRDKVGEEAYCIPIAHDDNNAPSFGQLKITVYTPLFFPKEFMDLLNAVRGTSSSSYFSNYITANWTDVPPVIYCKNFEIGYVYTDSNSWYSQHNSNNTNSEDIVYTNVINDDYVNDFSALELKINTQQKDKPISRSYVSTISTNVSNILHVNGDGYKEQEKNIIDAYYLHYNEPKRIYTCNIHGLLLPYSDVTVNSLGGKYIVDSQDYDVKKNNNQIKLIEF